MQGLTDALATLAKLKEAVAPKNMKAVEMDAAKILLDEFRATAPVVTGRFRDSAFIAEGTPDDPNVLFGIDFSVCPYAEVVEKGNRRVAPRATIQRAVAATQGEIAERIATGVSDLIQEALD